MNCGVNLCFRQDLLIALVNHLDSKIDSQKFLHPDDIRMTKFKGSILSRRLQEDGMQMQLTTTSATLPSNGATAARPSGYWNTPEVDSYALNQHNQGRIDL